MPRVNNYLIQAAQAKRRFLTYDREKLISKLHIEYTKEYLYVNLLCQQYRLSSITGDLQRHNCGDWIDANSYEEVMTVLDLVCDSREDRCATGRWVSAQTLGHMFHRQLLEQNDPLAVEIENRPDSFSSACLAMHGRPLEGCDLGFAVDFFEDLPIGVQFWHGDEEFPPRLRFLWDANTLQYLRYETTYFATAVLRRRLAELMDA